MKKLKEYQVYDEQFKQMIYLLVGDAEEAQKYIMKIEGASEIPNNVKQMFLESEGMCIHCNGRIVIWMLEFTPSADSISILVHEILHGLSYRASRCRTSSSLTHDNIYWIEMLVRRFLKQVMTKK